jgi:hypothetical protein
MVSVPNSTGLLTTHRTLVVLLGSARGGSAAWISMLTHLLGALSADLALCLGNTSNQGRIATLMARAKYVWPMQEPKDWGTALDAVAHRESIAPGRWHRALKQKVASQTSGLFGGAHLNGELLPGSGAIIFTLRYWLLQTAAATLDMYNRIVLTRTDHLYLCDHPNVFPRPGTVLVARGERYGGWTDRHHVFHPRTKNQALGVLPWLLRNPRKAKNPEMAIKLAWRELGVRVEPLPRCMLTVSAKGDSTRWWSAETPSKLCKRVDGSPRLLPTQLAVKYPIELDLALRYCRRSAYHRCGAGVPRRRS